MGHLDKFRAVHPEPDLRGQQAIPSSLPLIAGTEKATPKASRLKAEGYLNGLKQNAGDTEVIL